VPKDIFRNTHAFEYIMELGRREAIIEVFDLERKKGREEGGREGYKSGYQSGYKNGQEEERKEFVQLLRLDLLTIVRHRFPKLRSLAIKEVARIESPDVLCDLLVNIALAQTEEEAQNYLVIKDETNV
jgi:flagellar biosynthesis/type III secretory pathway protein FliH